MTNRSELCLCGALSYFFHSCHLLFDRTTTFILDRRFILSCPVGRSIYPFIHAGDDRSFHVVVVWYEHLKRSGKGVLASLYLSVFGFLGFWVSGFGLFGLEFLVQRDETRVENECGYRYCTRLRVLLAAASDSVWTFTHMYLCLVLLNALGQKCKLENAKLGTLT